MNRRELIAGGVTVAAATILPALPAVATQDEPIYVLWQPGRMENNYRIIGTNMKRIAPKSHSMNQKGIIQYSEIHFFPWLFLDMVKIEKLTPGDYAMWVQRGKNGRAASEFPMYISREWIQKNIYKAEPRNPIWWKPIRSYPQADLYQTPPVMVH